MAENKKELLIVSHLHLNKSLDGTRALTLLRTQAENFDSATIVSTTTLGATATWSVAAT
jgi:hypothetical protein